MTNSRSLPCFFQAMVPPVEDEVVETVPCPRRLRWKWKSCERRCGKSTWPLVGRQLQYHLPPPPPPPRGSAWGTRPHDIRRRGRPSSPLFHKVSMRAKGTEESRGRWRRRNHHNTTVLHALPPHHRRGTTTPSRKIAPLVVPNERKAGKINTSSRNAEKRRRTPTRMLPLLPPTRTKRRTTALWCEIVW